MKHWANTGFFVTPSQTITILFFEKLLHIEIFPLNLFSACLETRQTYDLEGKIFRR